MNKIEEIKDLYPYETKFEVIRSNRISYVDEGEGRPIVMVHGNPTWSFYFRHLIEAFKDEYRVIAIDHLGCGLSDKPQDFDYHLEAHIDNLEDLLLKLELKDITLVLHDWGGAIGMGFATRYPHLIKSVIILNSGAFTSKRIPLRIAACRIPYIGKKMILNGNAFAVAATTMAVKKTMPPEVKKGFLLPYDSPENRIAVNAFVEDIPMGPEHRSYETLVEIEHALLFLKDKPIAIIWGMKDWCFNSEFLKRWCSLYPNAEVLRIENAGHYVLEDAHEEVIPFIRKFLDKQK